MTHPAINRVLVLNSSTLGEFAEPAASFPVSAYEDTEEFVEALRIATPNSVALIDPFTPGGRVTWEARRILDSAGVVPVVAVLAIGVDNVLGMRELLGLGLADWIDTGMETGPPAALPRLIRVVGRPLKRRIDDALPVYVSQNARTLLNASVDVISRGGGAEELAAVLGVLERTVSGWCVKEGLPPPRRLHAWLRLLLAAALLEAPQRTILMVAQAAGYSTEQSMRRAIRTFIGEVEASSPRACSFDVVVRAFVSELGSIRDRRRPRTLP